MYWNYLKYVLNHKWCVFKVCMRKGLFIHAFTHDMSKFRPSEFIPYAKKFYGSKNLPDSGRIYIERDFHIALLHHYNRNKHHLAYWVDYKGKPVTMPIRSVKHLVADWQAMGLAKKNNYTFAKQNAIDFFQSNKGNMKMTPLTEYYIKKYLKIPVEK